MIDTLLASHNLPFAVALGVVLGLSALELFTALLGGGLSSLLDGLLPDLDLGVDVAGHAELPHDAASAHLDAALDAGANTTVDALPPLNTAARVLDWLHVGRVPTLILLLVLLASFGVLGLALQWFAGALLSGPWPAWLAAGPALLGGLLIVHTTGRGLAKLLPSEETSAVGRDTFVGKIATVTAGTATFDNPAQAKLRDEHGQVHYVLVRPERHDDCFERGATVVLVRQEGAVFEAVANELLTLPAGP